MGRGNSTVPLGQTDSFIRENSPRSLAYFPQLSLEKYSCCESIYFLNSFEKN